MASSNRFTILDPDTFTKKSATNVTQNNQNSFTGRKFIRNHINEDFVDSDDDLVNDFTHDDQTNESKWKKFDLNSEPKYKSFNPGAFSNFNNNHKKQKVTLREVKNKKKLLCMNVITNGACCYGNKCMYAHSLAEQQIDSNRKTAYEILFSTSDLSSIDFQENVTLYRSLRDLTKMCDREHCTGGYNCKHGVCGNKKYCICARDLDYGDCTSQNCEFVHLTSRGLKPFYSGYSQKQEKLTFFNIPGTLLTTDFIKSLPKPEEDIDKLSELSLDSISGDATDECDQSIFDEGPL